MRRIIRSELFLYFKSKTALFLFASTILVCFASLLMMNVESQNQITKEKEQYDLLKVDVDIVLGPYTWDINNLESDLNRAVHLNDQEAVTMYQEEISRLRKERNYYLLLQRAVHEINWAFQVNAPGNYYRSIIDFNNTIIENMAQEYDFYARTLGEFTKEDLLLTNEVYQIVIDKNYTPEFNQYTINLANFLLYFFSSIPIFIVTFIAMYVSIRVFADENNRDVYKVVYSSAYSRKEIILAKILVALITSLITITIALILASILIGLIFGIGTFAYPIPVYDLGTYATKGQLIVSQILPTILAFDAAIMITLLVTLITNSASIAVGLSLSLIVIHMVKLLPDYILRFSLLYYLSLHNFINLSSSYYLISIALGLFIIITIVICSMIGSRKEFKEVQ